MWTGASVEIGTPRTSARNRRTITSEVAAAGSSKVPEAVAETLVRPETVWAAFRATRRASAARSASSISASAVNAYGGSSVTRACSRAGRSRATASMRARPSPSVTSASSGPRGRSPYTRLAMVTWPFPSGWVVSPLPSKSRVTVPPTGIGVSSPMAMGCSDTSRARAVAANRPEPRA